ncbi:hypothetical protein J6590_033398 [Homalodisca vitripennis]|nr:hypothetical protein J6590_033398 [Homalodisca vitripennis]
MTSHCPRYRKHLLSPPCSSEVHMTSHCPRYRKHLLSPPCSVSKSLVRGPHDIALPTLPQASTKPPLQREQESEVHMTSHCPRYRKHLLSPPCSVSKSLVRGPHDISLPTLPQASTKPPLLREQESEVHMTSHCPRYRKHLLSPPCSVSKR